MGQEGEGGEKEGGDSRYSEADSKAERDQATEREKEKQFNNSTTDETQPLTLIYSRELAVHAKKEGAITEDNRRPTQVLFIQNQTPTALDNAAYNHHTTHLLVHTY